MSLICGVINRQNNGIEEIQIRSMLSSANTWGGHKQDSFHNNHVFLGQNLIYNSQESLFEKLPYLDQNSGLIICADCRIDNREELAQLLRIENSNEIPDSRFILESYKRYGEACIDHLIGAFAFAIWDKKKQYLFIARDHLGERPFYYYLSDGLFVFASTKGIILSHNQVDQTIDEEYLINYAIGYNQIPDATFHKHIKCLMPAHYMIISGKNVIKNKYWDLDIHKEIKYQNPQDYIDEFQRLMNQSVRCRIRSHNNVGMELSGGLDSGGVAAFAQKSLVQNGQQLYTYSNVMPKEKVGKIFPFTDEDEQIEELCSFMKIEHKYKISRLEKFSFLENIDEVFKEASGIDEYVSHSKNPMKKLAQSHNVGVILSGFTGDEVVSSFCRAYFLEYYDKGQYLKFYKEAISKVGIISALLYPVYQLLYKISPSLTLNLQYQFSKFNTSNRQKSKRYIKSLFKKEFLESNKNLKEKTLYQPVQKIPSSLKEYQRNHIIRYNTHRRMETENRSGYYHQIEIRYPLSDIRLLQFVLSIPIDQKINSTHSRLIYRRSLEGYIPKSIQWRDNKNGNIMPFGHNEFCNLLPERLEWLNQIKQDSRFKAFDIEKWIQKAKDLRKRTNNPYVIWAGGRQSTLAALIRYIEKNPNNLFLFNKKF